MQLKGSFYKINNYFMHETASFTYFVYINAHLYTFQQVSNGIDQILGRCLLFFYILYFIKIITSHNYIYFFLNSRTILNSFKLSDFFSNLIASNYFIETKINS